MEEYLVIKKSWLLEQIEKMDSIRCSNLVFNLISQNSSSLRPIIENALKEGFSSYTNIDRNYDPLDNEEGINDMVKEYLENFKLE